VISVAPPPVPARPRMTIVATALAVAGGSLLLAVLIANYLHFRSEAGGTTAVWLPSGTGNPQVAGTTLLCTVGLAAILAYWARWSIARADRPNGYIAVGLLAVFGIAAITAQAYCWRYMNLEVRTDDTAYAISVWSLTGAWVALAAIGVLFAIVMAFRTLGGVSTPKDAEGLSALAIYWSFLAVSYFPVWYVVYILK
jgi:heme/copper-type cytochrome/quinol oxidase subunit 3